MDYLMDDHSWIPFKKIFDGINASLQNAENFLIECMHLHDDRRAYFASIIMGITSIEESLKSHELLFQWENYEDVMAKKWFNELTKHKPKVDLKNQRDHIRLQNQSNGDLQNNYNQLEKLGFNFPRHNKEEMIKRHENRIKIYKLFENLRQRCLFVDWDKSQMNWFSFQDIPDYEQKIISLYVKDSAEYNMLELRLEMEFIVNECRKLKLKYIPPFTYPKYSEYRNQSQWDSVKERKVLQRKIFSRWGETEGKFELIEKYTKLHYTSEEKKEYMKF